MYKLSLVLHLGEQGSISTRSRSSLGELVSLSQSTMTGEEINLGKSMIWRQEGYINNMLWLHYWHFTVKFHYPNWIFGKSSKKYWGWRLILCRDFSSLKLMQFFQGCSAMYSQWFWEVSKFDTLWKVCHMIEAWATVLAGLTVIFWITPRQTVQTLV